MLLQQSPQFDDDAPDEKMPRESDPARVLLQLKARQGSWKVASRLITSHSLACRLAVKDAVMAVGKA